jgi:hypothetical protein
VCVTDRQSPATRDGVETPAEAGEEQGPTLPGVIASSIAILKDCVDGVGTLLL